MHQGKELQVLKVRKREEGCRGQRRFVPIFLRLVNLNFFLQISQPSQRTVTPRQRISMSQGNEEESTSSTTVQDQASKEEQGEEGSLQSKHSGE